MLAAVILAAGKGTRMRSEVPKVLHPLLGAPLLEYALDGVAPLEPDRTVVVVGHGRDAVIDAFADRPIFWVEQEEQLGTGHAAQVAAKALLEALGSEAAQAVELLILNGDLPCLRPETLGTLVREHRARSADVTILTAYKNDPSGFGRIVRGDEGGRLLAIVEERDTDANTRSIREVNVGVYVFRLPFLLDCCAVVRPDNRQGEYYLTDAVIEAVRRGGRVECVEAAGEEETLQVNDRAELARASEVLRVRFLHEFMVNGVTIDDPATTYIEKGVKIGADARIHPFTVIRRGVEIAPRAEVGPFAHLRPGTRLEEEASVGNFVEVKNARLGPGTKARHLTYIGDADIGAKVNVGAGTIFANFDGHKKHRTVVGDEAFIGSGTVLVAPVRIGRRAVTGAGAVVLRNRDVSDGEVVVGVPARPLQKKEHEKESPSQNEG